MLPSLPIAQHIAQHTGACHNPCTIGGAHLCARRAAAGAAPRSPDATLMSEALPLWECVAECGLDEARLFDPAATKLASLLESAAPFPGLRDALLSVARLCLRTVAADCNARTKHDAVSVATCCSVQLLLQRSWMNMHWWCLYVLQAPGCDMCCTGDHQIYVVFDGCATGWLLASRPRDLLD